MLLDIKVIQICIFLIIIILFYFFNNTQIESFKSITNLHRQGDDYRNILNHNPFEYFLYNTSDIK